VKGAIDEHIGEDEGSVGAEGIGSHVHRVRMAGNKLRATKADLATVWKLLYADAPPAVETPGATGGESGQFWCCLCCGAVTSEGRPDSSWRHVFDRGPFPLNVIGMQHNCPKNHPQAGWFNAKKISAGPPPVPDAAEVRVADAWNSKGPVYTQRPGEPVPDVVGAKCPECGGLLPGVHRRHNDDAPLCPGHGTGQSQPSPAVKSIDEMGNLERNAHLAGVAEREKARANVERNGTEAAETTAPIVEGPSPVAPAPIGVSGTAGGDPVTPPSAPVGRSEDEEGARRMCRLFHEQAGIPLSPGWWGDATPKKRAAWVAAFAFAAGSASSVSRERVRECLEKLDTARHVMVITGTTIPDAAAAALDSVAAKLKGLCGGVL
jgi:hypothetical protein